MTLVYNFMVLPYFQVEFYGIDAILLLYSMLQKTYLAVY